MPKLRMLHLLRRIQQKLQGKKETVVEPPKSEEATPDKVVNGAMENDAETAEISEESSKCENSVTENVASAKVDVDDELLLLFLFSLD